MSEEETTQEEQPQENEGVVMPSLEAEEPKPSIASEPEPVKPDLYEVDMDGKNTAVSKDEYDYLAKLGAQSLMAAQYQKQQAQEQQGYDQMQTADQPVDAPPEADYQDEATQRLTQRLGNLEHQLQEQKVQTAGKEISQAIDKKVNESSVFKGVKAIESDTDMELEVKKEIYNLSVAERIPVDKAFEKVEEKWSQLMGADRASFLTRKLKQQQASAPTAGGTVSAPGEKQGAKEWTNGQLLQSITERLINQDS